MSKYFPQQFEKKWRDQWEKEKVYKTPLQKTQKIYCLPMFPYPSGAGLHVGHVRIYTGCDVLARYFRMNGKAVLHPMGWDAFGLPAENAAIKAKKNPMDMVAANIANFKRQMKSIGLSYDWEREVATCDPDYYRWTQWLFIHFFKMGLLYKKNTAINFCPRCKTGLAQEEALSDGTHERCGSAITQKELPQWIFRITAYADRLLTDLKGLDWPAGIVEMQKNWIGRKEGINIVYKVQRQKEKGEMGDITCFTTRPDTNFGATFIVLAPEHEFVASLLRRKVKGERRKLQEIKAYVEKAQAKTEIERIAEGRKKTGVFTGFYAVNNLNGRLMPIWISDFVLGSVGTGAVVGVPGHDLRDFEFAQTFHLDIIRVVVEKDRDTAPIIHKEQVQEKEGTMINSDFLNGLDIHTATKKMIDYLEEKGWGKRVVTYHLRDWIFSRQRYWGEPIPMIFCAACAKNQVQSPQSKVPSPKSKTKIKKTFAFSLSPFDSYGWFPVSDNQLPVKLPYVKRYEPTQTGQSPLSTIESFVKTTCPHCGGEARRETDTMPNWAGSCWYFIYFAHVKDKTSILADSVARQPQKIQHATFFRAPRLAPPAFSKVDKHSEMFENWKLQIENSPWLAVDWYLGGAEHAVLHLLYARFWVKALYDLGLVSFQEPFLRLRNVGMVIAEDHRKMSKSFGNVINPDEVVEEYGADSLRIYEMFMAPFDSEISWSTKALQGSYRFLKRVWQIYHSSDNITDDINKEDAQLVVELQKVITKVTRDIPNVKFNTAIAAMMKFLNKWEKAADPVSEQPQKIQHATFFGAPRSSPPVVFSQLSKQSAQKFLQLLAPFAPFLAEEIWRTVFGEKTSVHLSSWPSVDEMSVKAEEVTIPIQVNGKLRSTMTVSTEEAENKDTVVKKAIEMEKIRNYIAGKKYEVVYVKGRVLNLVVEL